MRIIPMLVGVALLTPQIALADPSQAPPAPKKENGERKICVTEEFVGSMIPSRICKTKAEWDAARENSEHELDRRNGQLIMPIPKGTGG